MVLADGTNGIRDSSRLELRRGALVLAVLAALETEQYGYSLRKTLADQGLEIDEGTLYPLLRRLESQKLLESRWALEEARPRRYYVVNKAGSQLARDLFKEWQSLTRVLERLSTYRGTYGDHRTVRS